MYVPKVPRRRDFCGCPPCGICFDWVEPAPPKEVEKSDPIDTSDPVATGYRTDGVRKMIEEILGPDVTPTADQKAQIYEGAMLAHLYNLDQSKKTPQEAHQEIIDESFIRQGVEAFLKQKRIEAAVVRPPVNTRNLDDMADEIAKKEAEKKEETEKAAKEKQRVKAEMMAEAYYGKSQDAPVDEGLLQRERKYGGSYGRPSGKARDEYMERYRQNMAAEKARWEEMMRRR